jgi:hypothetical protein
VEQQFDGERVAESMRVGAFASSTGVPTFTPGIPPFVAGIVGGAVDAAAEAVGIVGSVGGAEGMTLRVVEEVGV